jgi:hypothetical protein
MKEKLYRAVDKFVVEFGEFVSLTVKDFKYVWDLYPNVLIWCGIAFLIALYV